MKEFFNLLIDDSIGIFGSKRPPKDKKMDKKTSLDSKSRRIPHIRRTRDDPNGNASHNSTDFKSPADNPDDFVHISTNRMKSNFSSIIEFVILSFRTRYTIEFINV